MIFHSVAMNIRIKRIYRTRRFSFFCFNPLFTKKKKKVDQSHREYDWKHRFKFQNSRPLIRKNKICPLYKNTNGRIDLHIQ